MIDCLGLVDLDCTFPCALLAKPDGLWLLFAILGGCSVSGDFIMLSLCSVLLFSLASW